MEECPYPKGDIRRTLLVLAAIDGRDGQTVSAVEEITGVNKGQVPAIIDKAREQFGMRIDKVGPRYVIRSWGDVLKQHGVKKLLAV